MRSIIDNLGYILLSIVAVILIVFTLRLQRLLISSRVDGQTSGAVQVLAEEVAAAPTATATQEPPTPTPTATATTPPLPTATLTPIPVLPPPTATPLNLMQPTVAPVATEPPTPTAEPPTPTPQLPTATPTPAADYVLGYLHERPVCRFVSEIMAALLEEKLSLQIHLRSYAGAEQLYAALAHTSEQGDWLDFTFCYLHPADSQYLGQFGSGLKLIGSAYGQNANQRWHLVSFSGHYVELRTKQPCLYTLFADQIDFGNLEFSEPDAAAWIANHSEQVTAWASCATQE